MAIKEQLTSVFGDDDTDEERISIDELTNDEIEQAIEHIEAIGRDVSYEEIERIAYHLRHVDNDDELFNAFESRSERSKTDRALVAPNNIEREKKYHTRDGKFYQILTATSLPRLVTPGWLVPLTLSEHNVRLSMHIKPRETSSVKGKLQQRLTQMKSAIQWKKRRGRTDVYEEEHEQNELERLLRNVIQGTTRLFEVGFYAEVAGDTHEEMEDASRTIQRSVEEQGMELTPLSSRQVESQQAVVPVGTDPIHNTNTVQLEALATFFNLVAPPIKMENGILMGFDESQRPIIVNRFALSGHSKAVTGKVGSGKTYSVKLSIYGRLLKDDDTRVIIFDTLGDDFVEFTQALGGSVIDFGGQNRINPLEIQPLADDADEESENPYAEKIRSVIGIIRTYLEGEGRSGLDAATEGLVSHCIHFAYASKGITRDPSTFHNESPIFDRLISCVEIVASGGLDAMDEERQPEFVETALSHCPQRTAEVFEDPSERMVEVAEELVPKFEPFKAGSVNANLNGHTNIPLDDDIICFNMKEFADANQLPLIMHTMLDWAYQETRRSNKRTDVTFEESHYLLDRKQTRKLINLFIRHARHFNAGLTLISQEPDDFLKSDERKEIYNNCDIKQLFYQENVDASTVEYFNFSEEETRYLRQAARGENSDFSECLLSTSEHGRRRVEIYADPLARHLLEPDLDAEGFLRQQGYLDGTEQNAGRSSLSEAMPDASELEAGGEGSDGTGGKRQRRSEPAKATTGSGTADRPRREGNQTEPADNRPIETPNDITKEATTVPDDHESQDEQKSHTTTQHEAPIHVSQHHSESNQNAPTESADDGSISGDEAVSTPTTVEDGEQQTPEGESGDSQRGVTDISPGEPPSSGEANTPTDTPPKGPEAGQKTDTAEPNAEEQSERERPEERDAQTDDDMSLLERFRADFRAALIGDDGVEEGSVEPTDGSGSEPVSEESENTPGDSRPLTRLRELGLQVLPLIILLLSGIAIFVFQL